MTGAPSAVLFDLGGVLFNYDPDRRLRYIGDAAGLPASEVQARVFDTDFAAKCEAGLLDGAASYAKFCRLLGVDWSYESYRDALVSAFEADGIIFGLARELASIREVGCLSNNGQTQKDGLACLHPDYAAIFADRVYFSSDLGHLKPSPEAFNAVLERWGKQPEDILFVDDTVDNLIAAQQIGFHIHRFFDAETLETDLRGFGLL